MPISFCLCQGASHVLLLMVCLLSVSVCWNVCVAFVAAMLLVYLFTLLLLYLFTDRPLWSSGQSSWLQIQSYGFDSQLYQIFWEVVGLERGLLSLVIIPEELLIGNNSRSGLECWEYGRMDSSRWPRDTLYPQKLALTSPTGDGL
jgi:hypothetical protein